MHEDICEFEVSVHYFVFSKCFECVENLYQKLNGFFFIDSFVFLEILREVSFVAILKYEIEIVSSFFDIIQLDNVLIVAGPQDFDFVLQQL